jgi:glycosyltransferase involved in cell wall biosynthesis
VIAPTPPLRRLVASSRLFEVNERLDLLIHAIAQLPNDVMLEVVGVGPGTTPLRLLAQAYGIEDRVRFSPSAEVSKPWEYTVYPSARNLSAAPLRPTDGQPRLVFDAARAIDGPFVTHTMGAFVDALSQSNDRAASLRFDDDILRGHRIVFVTNVPAPYRVELFAQVADRLEKGGASFDVIYLAASTSARPWIGYRRALPYRHHFLRGFELPYGERRARVPVDLEHKLKQLRPSVVISAGFSPLVSARVARWASRAQIPFGIYSGETSRMPTAHSRWRRLLRRRLMRSAAFGIAYGFESGEYLLTLAPSLPVVHARNTSRVPLRVSNHSHASVRVLTIADLNSPRKGIDILLDAMRLVPDLRCELSIVGGGRQLESLKASARDDSRVRLLGFLPRDETVAKYREADIFVFPTRQDVYGLVMVEAMGAGLATLVSSAPGALGDLAVDGTNCLIVEAHTPEAWAQALSRVVVDPGLRRSLGAKAHQTVARRWTLEHSADAMIAGFRLGGLVAAEGSLAIPRPDPPLQ